MAVSASSMSDEPHSSYSSPSSRSAEGHPGGKQQVQHQQQQASTKRGDLPPPSQHKKKGWARFKSRVFGGGRKNNNRQGGTDRAETKSAFTQGSAPRQHQMMQSSDERQSSLSAMTQGSPPLYSQPTRPAAAEASRRKTGFLSDSEPRSYTDKPSASPANGNNKPSSKPRAYHESYYTGEPAKADSAPSHSISARDFRGKSLNAFAYTQEDESYANIANQEIDEDLEVSYFNP
eukprot:scaffold5169_cov172-Amphora_coffeaeformis.AAC.22